MSCKNRNYKSAQVAYNNNTQDIIATGTTVNVLGSLLTNTGCSIATVVNGFKINSSGLYRIHYTVTVAATAAGILTAQLYKDGVALPCTLVQNTVADGDTYTIDIEAPALCLSTCCNICPTITAIVGGVTGTINYTCASALKLA